MQYRRSSLRQRCTDPRGGRATPQGCPPAAAAAVALPAVPPSGIQRRQPPPLSRIHYWTAQKGCGDRLLSSCALFQEARPVSELYHRASPNLLEVEPPLFHTRLGPRFIAQTAPSLDATLAFPPNRMRACRLELSRRLLDYGQGPLHVCGARGPRRGKACILAFPFASTGLAALSIRVGGEEGSMPVPRQPGLPQLVEGGGVPARAAAAATTRQ